MSSMITVSVGYYEGLKLEHKKYLRRKMVIKPEQYGYVSGVCA
jgi:hypothetical protein